MPTPITQYAQIADLDTGINAAALAGVDPAVKTANLVDASAIIDGYLRDQFTLPLTGTVGGDIRRACVNIAVYFIMVGRGYNPDAGADPGIRERYTDALTWLKLVAQGTVTPTVTDSSAGSAEGRPGARPGVFSSSSRGFSSRGDPNGRQWPFQGD